MTLPSGPGRPYGSPVATRIEVVRPGAKRPEPSLRCTASSLDGRAVLLVLERASCLRGDYVPRARRPETPTGTAAAPA